MSKFAKAVKHQLKGKLAITGPSGAGKTYSALTMATAMKGDGRISVIDTESGSASLYADLFDFDVLEWKPPHPTELTKAAAAAAAEGHTLTKVRGPCRSRRALLRSRDRVDDGSQIPNSTDERLGTRSGQRHVSVE